MKVRFQESGIRKDGGVARILQTGNETLNLNIRRTIPYYASIVLLFQNISLVISCSALRQ